jgi:tetrahydromethanopterin S-methyltransferase subunit C
MFVLPVWVIILWSLCFVPDRRVSLKMDALSESFNLHQTVQAIEQAAYAVVCNIFFWAALHGIIMALVLGAIGYVLFKRKIKLGRPFMSVCRRLCLFCGIVTIPGLISLLTAHSLPPAGVANINSWAFLGFWGLICVHLSAEEMNYRLF